ncbi:MAG TPA: hypothetical protein VMT26_01750 [Candidatus Bathyarchaeia archaeon]|nr:hypothetical protein [Candidatus Bathyarchaeia archaeon]
MPARKMRVELFDSEGNRYSIAFEGQITRDKAVRLLDLVELLGGVSADGDSKKTSTVVAGSEFSKFDKVYLLIQKSFPVVWFSSREVQSAYEQEHKEPISLSTIATYLARLSIKGMLMKAGALNRLKYKLASTLPQATLKQQIT